MFINSAFAQEAAATATTAAPGAVAPAMGAGDLVAQFLPLILIFVIFYFLLIRPQQKKMKEHQAMLAALKKGDKVITGGGIIGTVSRVGADGEEVDVEIANGVVVKVQKSTIGTVLA